jgi:non-specific serine/threonine protein kinase/serine/threonine-protein kinase
MTAADRKGWQQISEMLDGVLNLPESEREQYLARSDRSEATKSAVRKLLAASRRSTHFLEHPVQSRPPMAASEPLLPHTRFGAYRIDSLLAQGGMGDVYRAARADGHFEKPVAFKLARARTAVGADRFHNERQILATLEHPGIARLIDGGLTDDGRPYMVMELVEGCDILSFCRTRKLGLEGRLALFGQVCDAVGYAHRHLVVHRDLKPSNILVSMDGRVKLLDFGIAKLLGAGAMQESRTLALMTPEYAAPEQLEGKTPTTGTDVFALGVLLHQLLCDSAPWNLGELPLPAALQRLLHTDPRPPSQCARENRESPIREKNLQGDMDAIVAKALRREPEARYTSVSALWGDLQSHLSHQPVLARGDARSYRVRRFLRRNRFWVGAATAVVVTLFAGMAGTLWQAQRAGAEARRAQVERDRAMAEVARSQSVLDYLDLMFGSAVDQGSGRSVSAKQMLDASADQLTQHFADRPAEKARVLQTLGDLYLSLHDFEGAAPLLSQFLETPDAGADPAAQAHIRLDLAAVELNRGNADSARHQLELAQTFWNRDSERYRAQLIHSRSVQAQVQDAHGDVAGSIQTLRAALAESAAFNGEASEDTMTLAGDLGTTLMQDNQPDEAEHMMNRAWNDLQATGRGKTEEGLTLLNNRAVNAMNHDDLALAEKLLRHAVDLRKQSFGPSAALARQESNLGRVLVRTGRPSEAVVLLDDALAMAQRFTGDHSQITLLAYQGEAEAQLVLKNRKAAESFVQLALEGSRAEYGDHHPMVANSLILLARLRLLQGKKAEARHVADQAERTLAEAGEPAKVLLPKLEKLKAELAAAGV